ncbi:hypothetical protein GQ53DRAFT_760680 [Thozetella sp. PMI_491]|nr:hypothetical protein GQ53DRAFT_760680 [Thozetella sp. PMI_491]
MLPPRVSCWIWLMARLGWSLTCLGTGFMKTVPQLYISRILIGLFESGMYPALVITLTSGALVGGIAVRLWAFISDFFEDAKFLKEEEKRVLHIRTEKHDAYLLSSFGFDSVLTQLLTVPIYAWGVAIYITASFFSDALQKRTMFMIPDCNFIVIGYAILLAVPLRQKRVLSCFLVVPAHYACQLLQAGDCLSIIMTTGQLCRGSGQDGSRQYIVNESVSTASVLGCFVLVIGIYLYRRRQNRIRDAPESEERQRWIHEGRIGSAHPAYRFILQIQSYCI